MDCNEARPLIDASVDRELSALEAARVQRHIEGCAACRQESERIAALSRAVRATDYHRAPAHLRERIVAGLADGVARERVQHGRRNAWQALLAWLRLGQRASGAHHGLGSAAPAGSAATAGRALVAGRFAMLATALAALAIGSAMLLRGQMHSERFVDELVTSHVRAQLSGRDIDVISSDQHTVKPWFNGRLDYAPPVEDLAAQGFPLAGGRLDYIGHRRVAVLVYRSRLHVIDVYVMPEQSADSRASDDANDGASVRVRDGYALVRWRSAGMVWWAVSDAQPEALQALKAALDARLGAARPGSAADRNA
ncbi:zf-HC2 domain-containing protein [Trinickia caryophylli]|uniref:Transmembrane transcriptional regulator (Anti-sigma factor RsiW) n=1 Tax=Trinickia caryophylli TaxID=28094 RepID=A0A1X7CGQ4_TRICW|nr:zf-HC2 domain-containing protein [Trinickia caryophylli]PMS11580.1 anti-sigma factor [Trinickia caryophylli]TRX19864.1 anti-sigma factor [Trinickia caryophylli]WQE12802.1 zf-HC2 domain-containing protein [Trinickia caryophylli]SME96248.1 Transmembrane transcriptional regulator (anti-sigma factor RsiW) [Trinickia caryophylli]GLU30520.1 hypothetical protein Busp01_03620 [Trinickia caryophylli]